MQDTLSTELDELDEEVESRLQMSSGHQTTGNTLELHLAARRGDLETVRFLTDNQHQNPLHPPSSLPPFLTHCSHTLTFPPPSPPPLPLFPSLISLSAEVIYSYCPVALQDPRITMLIQTGEKATFERATSEEEYCQVLTEKTYRIRKQVEAKRNAINSATARKFLARTHV